MRNYICTLLFCATASALFAQMGNRSRFNEQVESNRVAFFTQFLSLNTEQAQSFWPLYNEMRDTEQELRRAYKLPREIDALSDAEITDFLNNWKTQEQALIDNRAKYIDRIREVLTDRQVVKMLNAERLFKERLLKRLRQP